MKNCHFLSRGKGVEILTFLGGILCGILWLALVSWFPFTSFGSLVLNSSSLPNPDILRGWGFYLAGVGIAPLGLLLTYGRTNSIKTQADSLMAQTDSLREQINNEKDKNVTNAFTQSVELLAHKGVPTRQGAIYSLQGIAIDNPGLYSTILKITTSYVRDRSRYEFYKRLNQVNTINSEEKLIKKLFDEPMPIDIDAAIEVVIKLIKQRERLHDVVKDFRLDLSNAYIFNVNFTDIDLNNTIFSDSKILKVVFTKVNLSDSFFKKADLRNLSFRECVLKNCDFEECSSFTEIEFIGCDLTEAKIPKGSTVKIF